MQSCYDQSNFLTTSERTSHPAKSQVLSSGPVMVRKRAGTRKKWMDELGEIRPCSFQETVRFPLLVLVSFTHENFATRTFSSVSFQRFCLFFFNLN